MPAHEHPAPHRFDPAAFLRAAPSAVDASPPSPQPYPNQSTTALLILNQPIASLTLLTRLWHHSSYHLCADGGANRLHDLLLTTQHQHPHQHHSQPAPSPLHYLPSAIHGDLDSLRATPRAFYAAHGVPITRDPDQYSTDLGKALRHLDARVPRLADVLVLGGLGGRVDQGLGLVAELGREMAGRWARRVWLFSERGVSWVLPPGESVVVTEGVWGGEGEGQSEGMSEGQGRRGVLARNVGVIPVYGRAVISTRGLEWDVRDWPTEMLGQVSSSNHIVAQQVEVRTDSMVLFTVETALEHGSVEE